jgi:carboxyl-terminal processing protease
MDRADRRPFTGSGQCLVTLPAETGDPYDPVDMFRHLLIAEAAELEAELGCPVGFANGQRGTDAGGHCHVGPAARNVALQSWLHERHLPAATGPAVRIDRKHRVVVLDGETLADVGDAFQLLRTAVRSGRAVTTPEIPDSPGDIGDTIRLEVGETWPSFALRDLDWDEVFARHHDRIVAEDASLASLQRLFAELQDAHTWVRDRSANARLPYRAWVGPDGAWFTHIPRWSAAWAAGVRAGDTIDHTGFQDWWNRTAATPRTRAVTTGYRWLAGTVGKERTLAARKPGGQVIVWSETCGVAPWHEPVSWSVMRSGTGYLRIRGWMFTPQWVAAIDSALEELARCPRMIVDLRGNVGGQLIAAQHFRDRFLTGPTHLGFVQFSIGGGRLGERVTINGEPPASGPHWHKPVRFLIDRQTYSASEDAILGLGGLPHVQIVGEPSGGGSGRPRTIALGRDRFATISTALTFDRAGHCVESNGIPVDIALPVGASLRDPVSCPSSAILAAADRSW